MFFCVPVYYVQIILHIFSACGVYTEVVLNANRKT